MGPSESRAASNTESRVIPALKSSEVPTSQPSSAAATGESASGPSAVPVYCRKGLDGKEKRPSHDVNRLGRQVSKGDLWKAQRPPRGQSPSEPKPKGYTNPKM